MKKIISLVCFATLFLCSCTSDNDSTSSAVDDVLVIKTVESSDESSNNITYYAYNGKKISNITYSNADYIKQFTYTGDLITRIETYYNFTSALVSDENLTYDANGRLSVYERTRDTEPGWITRLTFTYSANTITSTQVTENATHTYLEQINIFHLSGGEVHSVENNSYTDGVAGYSYTQTYSYDSKNNPFRNVIGYDKLDLLNYYISDGYTRNVLSVDFNYPDPGLSESTVTMASSYNELNFPVTTVTTWFGTYPVTMEYFYE